MRFNQFDPKKTIESQLKELFNDLNEIGIKIKESTKYHSGYGEGVCLILTQLLDKYLISQNYIFKKPNFVNGKNEDNDVEDIVEDFNFSGNNNNIKENTNVNVNNNFNCKIGNYKPFNFTINKRFNSGKSSETQGN